MDAGAGEVAGAGLFAPVFRVSVIRGGEASVTAARSSVAAARGIAVNATQASPPIAQGRETVRREEVVSSTRVTRRRRESLPGATP